MAFPTTAAGSAPAVSTSGSGAQRGGACVLVPIGGSPAGESKLDVAAAQARVAGLSVILLHVLSEQPPSPDGSVAPEEAQARTYLDVLATRLRAGGVSAKTLVRSGPVAATVAGAAHDLGARLVVIGSDTSGPLARMLPRRRAHYGGYASAIMRAAPCPIMLVRPSDGAAVAAPSLRRFEDDAARVGPVEPRALGHRIVDVSRIIGLAGDLRDLGADFRPLQRTRDEPARFRRTIRALEREVEQESVRPIVEVRKLGYGYYVATQPRRVAAARHLGRLHIDAVVTEYVSSRDDESRRTLDARQAFEETTGLQRIGAALPDSYAGIEALVREFGAGQRISDVREAAMRWYAAVFRPLQIRIRERRLHEWFPGERTADVVLRVARFDAAGGRRAATWEDLLDGFAATWGHRRPSPAHAA